MSELTQSLALVTLLLLLSNQVYGQNAPGNDCFGEGLPKFPLNTDGVRRGIDDFALKLFTDIATSYPRNTIVLSPYSIWSVLNLAYLGSSGATEQQLSSALGIPSKSDAFYGAKVVETKLQLNNGTILNKADKAYFSNTLSVRECAINKLTELERLDFQDSKAAADKINKDVSDATDGRISRFLSPGIIKNSVFVLLNAVYFKGLWKFPFTEDTTKQKFYKEDGKVSIGQADMMITAAKLNSGESEILKATVLELPYENSNISMVVILPRVGETTVNDVLRQLTPDVLREVENNFTSRHTIVELPRFKITTRIANELKTGLKNLGVIDLFEPGKTDLSKFLGGSETVSADSALHHATIEVTEEGTVASAATGLVGTRSGVPLNTLLFKADRPFIYLIRDISQGITLFMGVFRNPNDTIPF